MPWNGLRWESKADRQRRLARKRAAKRRRSQERFNPLDPGPWLELRRREMRKRLRRLPRPLRNKVRRKIRHQRYRLRKRVFGPCLTCGRAGGPGHVCRIHLRGSSNLRRRLAKRGIAPRVP